MRIMIPREGEVRIPSGCAISGIMDRSGARHDGSDILKSISLMHDRSNGLGGGFAAYGIYPDYKDFYAFHMLYESFPFFMRNGKSIFHPKQKNPAAPTGFFLFLSLNCHNIIAKSSLAKLLF